MSVINIGAGSEGWGCFGAGGFFETIRIEDGRPHLLGPHLARLYRSAAAWGFPVHCSAEELAEAVCAECAAGGSGGVRGIRIIYGAERVTTMPREITPEYLGPITERLQWTGHIVRDAGIMSASPLAGHKCTDRMPYERARRIAAARAVGGHYDAIVVNEKRHIVEGGVSSLFWVKGSELLTPSAACGGLPGVFADYVIGLAEPLGIIVRRVEASPEELLECDAAFLTNSLGEIMGLKSIDGKKLTPTFDHPVGKALAEAAEAARPERGAI